MDKPKVSIIMPSLNVGPYIEECVDSVLAQTLKEIEVICVDAGSTDGTLEKLQAYEQKDPRVHVVLSDRKSYGYQVNLGFDHAHGEYLGIVETDDFAEPDMFEKLYTAAKRDDLDVCKAGFYFYWSKPEVKNEPSPIASEVMASRVFCPLTDFRAPLEQVDFFNIKPSIWSAIYRRSFIEEQGIRLNETPGASFQDTAFNFKVYALAKRVRLLTDCVLHYRQDNEQSSINNPGKVYCLCDEYQVIDEFLDSHPELKGKLEGIKVRLKYDGYIWNVNRLDESLKMEFLERASQEFKHELEMGYADRECFVTYKWKAFLLIIQDPAKFKEKGLDGIWAVDIEFDDDTKFMKLWKKINGGIYCIRDHGFVYTVKLAIDKLKNRQNRE